MTYLHEINLANVGGFMHGAWKQATKQLHPSI